MGSWRQRFSGAVVLAGLGLVLAPAAPALAATGGYGPGTPTQPGVTGSYSSVVSVCSTPAGGTTCTAVVNGATITVTVPPGDLTAPAQVVFIAGAFPTSGVAGTPELAFGVQIDQNGAKLPGPFANPISVTATDPVITAGATVYDLTGSGYTPATGWTTTAGKASGAFTNDVDYLIASTPSTTSATIPGATLPVTGRPFLGEGLLAAGLLGLGGLLAWRWRRAARSAV